MPTAVCVVGQDINRTVVVHKPVENVDGFPRCSSNDFHMEGRIPIRDVRVELDDRVSAIVSIHRPASLAFAVEVEMLSVGG